MSHPYLHHSWGTLLRAHFDCSQQPLPNNLEVLLCFLDGAERRRHMQTKLNNADPPRRVKCDVLVPLAVAYPGHLYQTGRPSKTDKALRG